MHYHPVNSETPASVTKDQGQQLQESSSPKEELPPQDLFRVASVLNRFQSLNATTKKPFVDEAVLRRMNIGEGLLVSDVDCMLSAESSESKLCRKHYMLFNGIFNRLNDVECVVCKKKPKDKHVKPIATTIRGDVQQWVLSEILCTLLSLHSPMHPNYSTSFSTDGDDEMPLDDYNEEEVQLQKRSLEIIDKGLGVCNRCHVQMQRRLAKMFSVKPEGFPDAQMYEVCQIYEEKLHSDDSILETVFAKDMYDEYCNLVDSLNRRSGKRRRLDDGGSKLKSYRTFMRSLVANTSLCVFRNCSTGHKKGSVVASFETVKNLVSDGCTTDTSGSSSISVPTEEEIQIGLRALCKRYAERQDDYIKGTYNWRSWLLFVCVYGTTDSVQLNPTGNDYRERCC